MQVLHAAVLPVDPILNRNQLSKGKIITIFEVIGDSPGLFVKDQF